MAMLLLLCRLGRGLLALSTATPECLGEQRGPETSLAHPAFPWACPKCFKKGKAALEKMLLGPAQAIVPKTPASSVEKGAAIWGLSPR